MKNGWNIHLYNQLVACLDLMEKSEPKLHLEEFKEHVERQDKYRNQNTQKYIPWLYVDK